MARARERGPWFWRTAIAVMVAVVLALFAYIAFNGSPAVAEETGCRVDRKDPAHTIIVIDQSDPFNENDLGWVYEFVDMEARSLPRFGRLTVITPNSASPYDPKTIYVKCSPGSIDDANPILQNPRMIDDTWRDTFYKPLVAEIETALLETRQPSSPLFEAMYSIADRADFQATRKNRRVILVSDLMQHSDALSFYRTGTDMEAYRSSSIAQQQISFSGAEVVARIVPRQEYDLPLEDLKSLWRTYFTEAGAEFGSVN